MRGKIRAFIDGVITGIVAHGGAVLAVATIDRLLYIMGHIAVAVAINIAGRR